MKEPKVEPRNGQLASKKQKTAGTDRMQLASLRQVWYDDLMDSVIPFWLKYSLDHEYGGYFTCLDEDGSIYDDTKYMWLNGRALYTWSKLYCDFPGHKNRSQWRQAAELGAGFLDKAKDEAGLLFFSTTRRGERLHFQRKPFSAVFYVQGMLQYWRLLRTVEKEGGSHKEDAAAVLRAANDMFEKLLLWIEDPSLCGRPKPEVQVAGSTALGEIMCIASLSLDFYHTVDDEGEKAKASARIKDAMCMVRRHYDPARQILMEHCGPSGLDPSTPSGRLFNPGHSIEVAWFLLQMCEVHEDDELKEMALNVIEASLQCGWDPEHGGITYMMDIEGRPMLDATVTNTDKLWWPMTEALIALTMAYTLTGAERWLVWLRRVHDFSYAHFADKQGGEWFGYLTREGIPRHRCKGGNYKGFFHLPRALIMCVQMADNYLGSLKVQ